MQIHRDWLKSRGVRTGRSFGVVERGGDGAAAAHDVTVDVEELRRADLTSG